MHALFHIRTVIILRNRYRPEGFSPRVDIGRGMITVLIWKRACINLFITYFNIELKRTKLTSQADTKLMDMSDRYRLRVLLPKRQQIFPRRTSTFSKRQVTVGRKWGHETHERLEIVLAEFCPMADIAVALPVFTHGQNWRYYLLIINSIFADNVRILSISSSKVVVWYKLSIKSDTALIVSPEQYVDRDDNTTGN
jgi:hypothetical protein